MNYIKNIISAYDVYDELRNTQVGTTLEDIINLIKQFDSNDIGEFKPTQYEDLFTKYKKPYDICYGALEMLRAMKILLRTSENKALYKLTSLGIYITKQNDSKRLFLKMKIIKNLKTVKVLIKYIRDKQSATAEEISDCLGNEMIYYNKILLDKSWKKPFNIPVVRTLLELLVEFNILLKDPQSKQYFLES